MNFILFFYIKQLVQKENPSHFALPESYILLMRTAHCWQWHNILYSLGWTHNWTERMLSENLRHRCSVGCCCLEVLAALPCACVSSAVLLLKGPFCSTDPGLYRQTACVISMSVSTSRSNAGGTPPVEPVEQPLLHHSAHLMVHSACHITDTRPNTTFFQLLFGCGFIAVVRMWWDGFQS